MEQLTPSQLRQRFVEAATQRFARNVPDFMALQELVREQGGVFLNDHGAIRTADPALCQLFVRAARAMGLVRERAYSFPAKKLVSFDLQVIGESAREFKIFVSEVDVAAFPPAVAELVRRDCAEQAASVDHGPFIRLLEKAETVGGLRTEEAEHFIAHLLSGLMARPGPPLARATLEAVSAVSPEAASALALGADFNHVTIDVRAAGFAGIDAMAATMTARGFRLLPHIQGAPGTALRQTATMAATVATPVREPDGRIGSAATEKQFVEIIERSQARDADGARLWQQDGQPLLFRNFLAANAAKIFDAAATRTGAASC